MTHKSRSHIPTLMEDSWCMYDFHCYLVVLPYTERKYVNSIVVPGIQISTNILYFKTCHLKLFYVIQIHTYLKYETASFMEIRGKVYDRIIIFQELFQLSTKADILSPDFQIEKYLQFLPFRHSTQFTPYVLDCRLEIVLLI